VVCYGLLRSLSVTQQDIAGGCEGADPGSSQEEAAKLATGDKEAPYISRPGGGKIAVRPGRR